MTLETYVIGLHYLLKPEQHQNAKYHAMMHLLVMCQRMFMLVKS